MLKEERYAPPKMSMTPEDSAFAGEAVDAEDGAANASTAVKNRGTWWSSSAQGNPDPDNGLKISVTESE